MPQLLSLTVLFHHSYQQRSCSATFVNTILCLHFRQQRSWTTTFVINDPVQPRLSQTFPCSTFTTKGHAFLFHHVCQQRLRSNRFVTNGTLISLTPLLLTMVLFHHFCQQRSCTTTFVNIQYPSCFTTFVINGFVPSRLSSTFLF